MIYIRQSRNSKGLITSHFCRKFTIDYIIFSEINKKFIFMRIINIQNIELFFVSHTVINYANFSPLTHISMPIQVFYIDIYLR
ncbi:hypothetical protein CRM93_02505 [Acetobacter fabarum]|uniref:Uncharacterized protein n=1 Tax=Acetobacter fabarum TaxID=483199 RepID=A0A269Y056_9PROT|nr:hypothetical protein B8X00_03090 [Acetobacter fabarum]PEN27947.1 hypothetical protein CRM93_02505 [Acetobacter fabarum]